MKGKRTIRSIRLTNFLSYGPKGEAIELEPLNVLIGANATGKSNFLEAFRFLHKLPGDLAAHTRSCGGAPEFLWKGDRQNLPTTVEVSLDYLNNSTLTHALSFTADSSERLDITHEHIGIENYPSLAPRKLFEFPHNNREGKLEIFAPQIGRHDHLAERTIEPVYQRSIVSVIRDPSNYPYLSDLESLYTSMQFGGEWDVSRYGVSRRPHRTDLPTETLLEDASNLGLVLFNLPSKTKTTLTEHLQKVYEGVEELSFRIEVNTLQTLLSEKGMSKPTPLIRFSQGTLRYLCLLATLLAPTTPPLICIEEPENSLHPYALFHLADLMKDAAQRTQLIVATQSDSLISGLNDVPESVIVCERDEDGTNLRRLKPEQIAPWLDRYALGDLWTMGELGGLP